jgi:hypothetical protein
MKTGEGLHCPLLGYAMEGDEARSGGAVLRDFGLPDGRSGPHEKTIARSNGIGFFFLKTGFLSAQGADIKENQKPLSVPSELPRVMRQRTADMRDYVVKHRYSGRLSILAGFMANYTRHGKSYEVRPQYQRPRARERESGSLFGGDRLAQQEDCSRENHGRSSNPLLRCSMVKTIVFGRGQESLRS